jgi:hypothetical protein
MSSEISYVSDQGGDNYLDVTFYQGFWDGQDTDFIRIGIPGDKNVVIDTQATEEYKARFKRQWDAYRGFKDLKGHPIEEWDEIVDGMKKELAYQGFKFVEQLAGAPDAAFARLMGGTQLRAKARAFLDRGKINSDIVIKEQASQIQELQEKMAILMEALNEKPKRGRKADDEPPLEE